MLSHSYQAQGPARVASLGRTLDARQSGVPPNLPLYSLFIARSDASRMLLSLELLQHPGLPRFLLFLSKASLHSLGTVIGDELIAHGENGSARHGSH